MGGSVEVRLRQRAMGAFVRHLIAGDASPSVVIGDTRTDLLGQYQLAEESLGRIQTFGSLPTVYACIDRHQNSLAEMPLRFYTRAGAEIPPSDDDSRPNWAWIFSQANPNDTGVEVLKQLGGSMLIHGTGYLFIEYDRTTKLPIGIRCLPGHVVMPIVINDVIDHYILTAASGKKTKLPARLVIPFPLYNPQHDARGQSPLDVLMTAARTQRNMQRWIDEFYKRGAVMAGFFSTPQPLLAPEQERLELSLRQRHQGIKNAWNPVVLPRDIKFEQAGITVEQMRFIESHQMTDAQICMVYRIPPLLVGKVESSGLSDAGLMAQLLLHHEIGVKPLARMVTSAINERILRSTYHRDELRDGAWECRFDDRNVLSVQRALLDRALTITTLVGRPVMERNEGRELLGLPPLEDEPLNPDDETTDESAGGTGQRTALAARDGAPPALEAEDREATRDRHAARTDSGERTMRTGLRKLFAQQERRTVAKLREVYHDKATAVVTNGKPRRMTAAVDVDQLLELSEADRRVVSRTLRQIAKRAGETTWQEDLRIRNRRYRIDEALQEWIGTRTETFIVGTTATTRTALRATVAEGIKSGETQAQIVARIREVFSDRYAGQGDNIVRTEATGAFNRGSMNAWEQSGEVEGKEWLTAKDDRVRETHAEADGQVVGLDENFKVGADSMPHPGGGALAEENCNCRCTALPVLKQQSGRASTSADSGELDRILQGVTT